MLNSISDQTSHVKNTQSPFPSGPDTDLTNRHLTHVHRSPFPQSWPPIPHQSKYNNVFKCDECMWAHLEPLL